MFLQPARFDPGSCRLRAAAAANCEPRQRQQPTNALGLWMLGAGKHPFWALGWPAVGDAGSTPQNFRSLRHSCSCPWWVLSPSQPTQSGCLHSLRILTPPPPIANIHVALHLQQKKASGLIWHLSNKHKLRESTGLHCPKGKLPTCYGPVLPLCTAARLLAANRKQIFMRSMVAGTSFALTNIALLVRWGKWKQRQSRVP